MLAGLVVSAALRVLVVPFEDVSAVSGKMPPPTAYLVDRLKDQHFDVKTSAVLDPMLAISGAAQLCTENSADAIVAGTLELSRTDKFVPPISIVGVFFRNASTFTQDAVGATTGVIAASGVLSRAAIQARLRLYLIDCSGKLRWLTTAVVGEMHHGNNVGSGFTEIVERAIGGAVTELLKTLP